MAYNVTLTTLLTDIRTQCAMENSQVCTDAEITQYINNSGTWLNDILSQAFGSKYNLKKITFTLTPGTDTYNISDGAATIKATDFMALQRLEVRVNGSQYVKINEIKLGELDYYQNPSSNMTAYGPMIAYTFLGPSLLFAPVPQIAYAMRMFYTACWTNLASGSDVMDAVDGWHQLIMDDVCIKILRKQDLPCDEFIRSKQEQLDRINQLKQNRDTGNPPRITDVAGDYHDRFTTWGRFGS